MGCTLQCGCNINIGLQAPNGLPKRIRNLLDSLRARGANLTADALFTFFWDTTTDLDIWVFHKETGEFVSYKNKNNSTLRMNLDVDANAGSSGHTTSPIENIGLINSTNSPDGTYEVYLDNYNDRNGGNNFFNFVTLFREEANKPFKRVLWMRNRTRFDAPRGDGNKNRMLHVVNIKKEGKNYKVTWHTPDLEIVHKEGYAIENS